MMSDGENRQSVTLDDILRMVERLVKNQDKNKKDLEQQIHSMEHRFNVRIDKLQHQVVGNGDERAVIVRLRDMERTLQSLSDQVCANKEVIDHLNSFQETWRNRVIGIALAFPIITALLVIVLSYVLGISFAPS